MDERWWLPGQTVVVGVAPETYLRRMAQDLAEAEPPWRLRAGVTSIQAVAHAFAMLGLVSAEGAAAAMAQAEPGAWTARGRRFGARGLAGTSLRLLEPARAGAACPGLDP